MDSFWDDVNNLAETLLVLDNTYPEHSEKLNTLFEVMVELQLQNPILEFEKQAFQKFGPCLK